MMRAPKMGICERAPAEVPAAISRLPPDRTYPVSEFSSSGGSVLRSESTMKA